MGTTDMTPEDLDAPTAAVRVYRSGELLVSLLCESADEAADSVMAWSELPDIEVEVEDLSPRFMTRRAGHRSPSGH